MRTLSRILKALFSSKPRSASQQRMSTAARSKRRSTTLRGPYAAKGKLLNRLRHPAGKAPKCSVCRKLPATYGSGGHYTPACFRESCRAVAYQAAQEQRRQGLEAQQRRGLA